MKSLIIAAALVSLVCASSKVYNFNTNKYCGSGRYIESSSLASDDRATLIVRKPSGLITIVEDRCSMSFSTALFSSKSKFQVRFDSIKRKIKDGDVTITFYDYDSVKASKKIMEVSKAKPIGANSTFTTKSRYLTIEVNRDVSKSKDYDVEIILEPVSSTSATKWSFVTVTLAFLIGYLL